MSDFPRTMVGGVSMPRLICGTNWLLGYSHTSAAKDRFIREFYDTPQKMANLIEVFARAGINAVMGPLNAHLAQAIREVEQRVGVPMIWVSTPSYAEHGNPDTWKQSVEQARTMGATFCFPHMCVTDPRIDRINNRLDPQLLDHLRVVREFGMIPGLSSHMPEAVTCSDACGADVESYIQIYNAAGFLCQIETDWVQRVIQKARKPVMTIKPLAAGRLLPPTGLTFVWNTLRDCDMVTIGTMTTYEAEEVIEISRACLENRKSEVSLQYTRSKSALVAAGGS